MSTAFLETEESLTGAYAEEACQRIAPLWPLENFVAVNPFLGLTSMPFAEAARLLDRVSAGPTLMSAAYYQEQLQSGAIGAAEIRQAMAERGLYDTPENPVTWLEQQLRATGIASRVCTVADWLDAATGSSWTAFVRDEVSKWCSSYFDKGQSPWQMPWKDAPLYEAWRNAARLDANPEVGGLKGFRRHVAGLPKSADEAIDEALLLLRVPGDQATEFLHRELISVYGWSAYAAYQDRSRGGGQDLVRQVLAIRLAYDTALLALAQGWRCETLPRALEAGFTEGKYIAQLALEQAFRGRLAGCAAQVSDAADGRNELQAVFCIDVRSERFRRALEAQSPKIETIGFAGFFGMPIGTESSARCPVLLAPKYEVQEEQQPTRWQAAASDVWKRLASSAGACFPAVEVAGAWFGLRMVQRELRAGDAPQEAEDVPLRWTISTDEMANLAAGALKNMSLDPAKLAPLVLLCGHGSTTENNPYGSSLDCGACGGHKGNLNARFAAAILNDAKVRGVLAERGLHIPNDTVFLAGLHDTTTDDVTVYGSVPASHAEAKRKLTAWLRAASEAAREERYRRLDGVHFASKEAGAHAVHRRSSDWAEVRPEWGLAGNAGFIAAPRHRTRHLHLDGRVFLHDYDWRADADGSVLELILTAPLVVASWINLQYFGSTVNPGLYGSGNKVLHNVVGGFGVWEGNGGDLRTGLPLQSLHDGTQWRHEPLRLQAIIDAPRERIDRVLRKHAGVRQLVENEWICLMAMGENGCGLYRCDGVGVWRPV